MKPSSYRQQQAHQDVAGLDGGHTKRLTVTPEMELASTVKFFYNRSDRKVDAGWVMFFSQRVADIDKYIKCAMIVFGESSNRL